MINRIVHLVEEHGISGKELGEILNLKKSPLTDWKNQKSKPTIEQVIKICEHFAITSDYLLFGKEDKQPQNTSNNVQLSEDETEVVNNYRELDYENKVILKGELFKLKKEQQSSNKKDGVLPRKKVL